MNFLHVLKTSSYWKETDEQRGGADANRINFLLLCVGLAAAISLGHTLE